MIKLEIFQKLCLSLRSKFDLNVIKDGIKRKDY